jgi:predicted CXXCH cytochrome family protein
MRDSKDRFIVLFRIKPVTIGLMLLVFFGVFFLSCDEVERHKTLTFFFDGVPPLGQEGLQEESLEPNSPELAQMGQTPTWYVHEPRKDCSICHGKHKQRSFSSQMYLTAPVPKLCYDCHTDYTVSAPFVHGPVAVGQCLFCHNPHKSKIEHLLNEPEPGLCYLCHDINTIELIAAHLPKQLSACTDCHNPHASSAKALLKGGSSQTNGEFGRPKMTDAASQDYIRAAKGLDEQSDSEQGTTAPATLPKSKSLSEVFRETSRLIELGELQQAGAYLEKFKDNNAFTAEERGQIARVLGMINSVITKTERQHENDEQQQKNSRNEQKSRPPAEKTAGSDNQSDKKIREIAELYYSSMAFYRTGQLLRAREGFVKILKSGLIPESMAKTIRGYISDIDNSLAGNETSKEPKQ